MCSILSQVARTVELMFDTGGTQSGPQAPAGEAPLDGAAALEVATRLVSGVVAGIRPEVLSAGEAARQLHRLVRLEKLCATGRTLLAGQLADTDLWRDQGDRSVAHWLARLAGTAVRRAAQDLDAVAAAAALAATDHALRTGDLSLEQAHHVTRAASVDPSAEGDLLVIAADRSLIELSREADRREEAARSDTDERYQRVRRHRYFRHGRDRNGAFHAQLSTTPDDGARLLAGLRAHLRRRLRRRSGTGPEEPYEAHLVDALVDLVAQATYPTPDPTPDPTPATTAEPTPPPHPTPAEPDTIPEAPADTTPTEPDTIPEAPADTTPTEPDTIPEAPADPTADPTPDPETDLAPNPVDDRIPDPMSDRGAMTQRPRSDSDVKVIVRIDYPAWVRGHTHPGETCAITGVGPLPVTRVQEMVDGGAFVAAVLTKARKVIGVAHLGRRPTALQRTALQWRDPECAVAGCPADGYLETDHRTGWALTGQTSIDDMDRLCSHHHRLKTTQGYNLDSGTGPRPMRPPQAGRHGDGGDDGEPP